MEAEESLCGDSIANKIVVALACFAGVLISILMFIGILTVLPAFVFVQLGISMGFALVATVPLLAFVALILISCRNDDGRCPGGGGASAAAGALIGWLLVCDYTALTGMWSALWWSGKLTFTNFEATWASFTAIFQAIGNFLY